MTAGNGWASQDVGFRAINLTARQNSFWVCGVGEHIATSKDGQNWDTRHVANGAGATLVGIGFSSDTFGFAYGTGGTVLTTEDGGRSWTPHTFGLETILIASLSSAGHGLVRTRSGIFYLDNGDLRPVPVPAGIQQRFRFAPFVVALTDEKMGVFLSEGPYSEGGYLTTVDGGKTWKFYDPPSTGVLSFLAVGGKYWASGHEVVGKDKPGGGYGVPMAVWSEDGEHWTHVSGDIRPCHWENCGVCNSSGCLGSGVLMVNFYQSPVQYFAIPDGPLTAKWASNAGIICSIQDGLHCAELGSAPDLVKAPTESRPKEQGFGPLESKNAPSGILRCIACSLEPVFIDAKVEGPQKIQLSLTVRSDGTMDQVTVEKSPSDALAKQIQSQVMEWLFEPPVKDGKAIKVRTETSVNVMTIRQR